MRSLVLLLALILAGCGSPGSPPEVQTAADSLAMDMVSASGGWDAWTSLPLLRFDWAFVRDSVEVFRARHLWDNENQRARVEWEIGEDSTAVVLIDLAASTPEAPAGLAFVNGIASPPADSLLSDGYGRFINDSYWLLAPMKVLDPGVNRSMATDSASGDDRVLKMSFGNVGLTPGDQYWMRSSADGTILSWTYVLEGNTTATRWDWSSPEVVTTPMGPLTLLTRKSKPDGTAIITPLGDQTPLADWSTPQPVLR